ncbi:hypothetical protein ATCC90586_000900 [Pythium insidiosum]|nr:hypothetical protein ATCC90586_000900 [Pythium insidiosum]
MDGASYHKRLLNPAPTSKMRKAAIQEWLHDHGVHYEQGVTKQVLLELVKINKPPPQYEAVDIARLFGHEILYTPPYHPELQPIEKVWGAIKNRIAKNPASTMAELGVKIGAEIARIESKQWVGSFRKVQETENEYMA